MTFQAKPTTYANDRDKVAFAASYFRDLAQSHYISYLQYNHNSEVLQDWGAFTEEFARQFGVTNVRYEAQQQLGRLVMGDRDHFSSHIIRFEECGLETGFNAAGLYYALYQSLPFRIKKAMETIPLPADYDGLRAMCEQIDNRYWEFDAEQKRYNSSKPNTVGNNSTATSNPRAASNPVGPARAETGRREPRGHLTAEERAERERKGLCMYCGKPHKFEDCPTRKPVQGRATFTIEGDNEEIYETYTIEEETETPASENEEASQPEAETN